MNHHRKSAARSRGTSAPPARISLYRGLLSRLRAPFAALGLATLMSAAFASCGEAGSTNGGGRPCDTVYAGKCGGLCGTDADCAGGLYCDPAGACTADCAAGAASCPAGFVCSSDGRCNEGGGAGGSDIFGDGGLNGASSSSGGQDVCADINVQIDKQIPTVVLLIDQSGSMTAAFGGGNRWDVLRDALMDPGSGVVKLLEKEVRFGLTLYSGKDADPVCPLLVDVPIALNNHGAINAVYAAADPIEDTPTGESIQEVTKTLNAFAEPGPKIIVLATDGEPDTCTFKDPSPGTPEAQMARDMSVKAAQDAYAMKIGTFVIAVGDQISQAHLQDVANAGAGKAIGGADKAKFYQPTDQQALVDAFNEIINGVRTCVFTLNGKVDAALADQGSVVLDGGKLGFNDPNGWKLNNPSEIEIVGSACDTIQSGEHALTVTFPCGSVVIDPN